jgi:hypothetical protein
VDFRGASAPVEGDAGVLRLWIWGWDGLLTGPAPSGAAQKAFQSSYPPAKICTTFPIPGVFQVPHDVPFRRPAMSRPLPLVPAHREVMFRPWCGLSCAPAAMLRSVQGAQQRLPGEPDLQLLGRNRRTELLHVKRGHRNHILFEPQPRHGFPFLLPDELNSQLTGKCGHRAECQMQHAKRDRRPTVLHVRSVRPATKNAIQRTQHG